MLAQAGRRLWQTVRRPLPRTPEASDRDRASSSGTAASALIASPPSTAATAMEVSHDSQGLPRYSPGAQRLPAGLASCPIARRWLSCSPRKGGLSGSAPTDASGHQSGSGRGRSLPVALRSRGPVSARGALDAIALASCAPTEAQKRSCGRRWADRSRRGMGCVAACGAEAVALSRATASTRWLVCGAGGSVAPGGGAAEFRIVGLEQHFPDSDGIAGRRPEREPR